MSYTEKQKLRETFLKLLTEQKEQDRTFKSRIIREKLLQRPEFNKAATILLYASFGGEVDTFETLKNALQLNKKIALPIIVKDHRDIRPALIDHPDRLIEGHYGIRQPQPDSCAILDPAELELVVVPGLAFDRCGNRLGRGAGYYDRFLSKLPKDIPTLGLAFDFQVVERLPLEAHDIALSGVITN